MKIEAKRAFVLADWMKAAQRCESETEFHSLFASERLRVATLHERELDQIIGVDESRLRRFEESGWTLDDVDVADCFVWKHMGGRPWAVGTVKEVSERFLLMEPPGSRIWKMKLFARIFGSNLPLITFWRDGKLEIDDGSHRAIAIHLAGLKKSKAYIGFRKK